MANAPYQPQNLTAEQADGNILLSWNSSLGATSYEIQRSTDGVNFTALANVGLVPQYLDPQPGVGIQYWYRVAAQANASAFATATLIFSGQPNNGDTLSIGNVVFTVGTSFDLGASPANTLQNLVNAVNESGALAFVVSATPTSDTEATLRAYQQGAEGNGLEFSSSLTNVSATSFSNGITPAKSPFSSTVTAIAAPPGEMSLYELRLRAQETADRVNSNFVTTAEWNAFLRIAMYELYDLLITTFADYNIADPVFINTNGQAFRYALPDGTNYQGGVLGAATGEPAPRLYKLSGIDLGVNTSNNAWVTLRSFDWIDRNNYVYPNSTSTIYGVYNMRYRMMGNNLNIIPTPAGNQQLRLWYAPILPALLKDTDLTTIGYSGWLRYPIVRAAKYALDKEEGADTSKLDAELQFLKTRIEQSAASRDQGVADTISNTRRDPVYGGSGWMNYGSNGGY